MSDSPVNFHLCAMSELIWKFSLVITQKVTTHRKNYVLNTCICRRRQNLVGFLRPSPNNYHRNKDKDCRGIHVYFHFFFFFSFDFFFIFFFSTSKLDNLKHQQFGGSSYLINYTSRFDFFSREYIIKVGIKFIRQDSNHPLI